ncbi:hypothetical protein [Pseudarthrobacter sp. NPDC080039]|uniref:hypothetical protein n=1 Tax=unclassified Pseudarthrobacter TaxID=2647000 RepID=UPI00344BE04F
MDLLSSFRRRRAAGTAAPAGRVSEPEAQELPTPEQLAQLQDAWAELAKAAEGSGLTGLHACSRNGRRWEEDPEAVRGLAAIIREVRAENANH